MNRQRGRKTLLICNKLGQRMWFVLPFKYFLRILKPADWNCIIESLWVTYNCALSLVRMTIFLIILPLFFWSVSAIGGNATLCLCCYCLSNCCLLGSTTWFLWVWRKRKMVSTQKQSSNYECIKLNNKIAKLIKKSNHGDLYPPTLHLANNVQSTFPKAALS